MTDTKPTVIRVEDREHEGTCGLCGKEGVRWIVVLDDGSQVGGECAKKILGWAPTAKKFSWVTGMTPTLTADCGIDGTVVLWTSESGRRAALSVNGHPQTFGPTEWIRAQYDKKWAPYAKEVTA